MYCNKPVEKAGKQSYSRLKMNPSNFACCSSTPEHVEVNVICRNMSRSSDEDHLDSDVLQVKNPCSNLSHGGMKNDINKKRKTSLPLNADTSDLLRQSDGSLEVSSSNKHMDRTAFSSNCKVSEDTTDLFSDEEDFSFSPLAALQKKMANVLDDQCQSLQSLNIQESEVKSSSSLDDRYEKKAKFMRCSEVSSIQQESSVADDSEKEENEVPSLAALASRLKNKNVESESSGSPLESLDSIFSATLTFTDYRERNLDGQNKRESVQIVNSPDVKSLYGERQFSHNRTQTSVTLSNESSSDDDDDETFSPLAALADRYHRGKDESSEKITKTICNCKSESEGCSSASSLSCSCEIFDEKREGKNIPTPGQAVFEKVCGSVLKTKEKDFDPMLNRSASSLSDLAFFHLTRSSSCSSKSGHQFHHKTFPSDSRISKSVPGSFVIPFLKQKEEERVRDTTDEQMEVQEGSVSDAGAESPGEWVIDLSGAICDPGSKVSYDVPEDETYANIMDIQNAEVEEDNEHVSLVPSQLDSSGLLKMKFSCTKRKCSSFGKVLCHQWRNLSRPYIPHPKQFTGTVIRFSFSTKSPDDTILFHLRRK